MGRRDLGGWRCSFGARTARSRMCAEKHWSSTNNCTGCRPGSSAVSATTRRNTKSSGRDISRCVHSSLARVQYKGLRCAVTLDLYMCANLPFPAPWCRRLYCCVLQVHSYQYVPGDMQLNDWECGPDELTEESDAEADADEDLEVRG